MRIRHLLTAFLALLFLKTHAIAENEIKPVHVVWQIDKKTFCETDWLQELLEGIDYSDVEDGQYTIFKDNSVIIIPRDDEPGQRAYFQQLNEKNIVFGVIQVGDETYSAPRDFYDKAQFVLRNYWHKCFMGQKNVHFIPLGYKRGYWSGNKTGTLPSCSHRPYVWSFAGQVTQKPTRAAMLAELKTIPHFFIFETFAWADPNALSANDYRELLTKSIFVPCPVGFWNLDSFRLYEALEVGAIPIIEKQPIDYFSLYYEKHPFISVDNWSEASEKINALLKNPYELEKTRIRCHEWWNDYKANTKEQIRTLFHRLSIQNN